MPMLLSLEDLLSGGHPHGAEAEEDNTSASRDSDLALLAERLAERRTPKRFTPGTVVRPRAPKGLSIPDHLLMVLRQTEDPLTTYADDPAFSQKAYMSVDIDTIVGVVMDGQYREIMVWSGFLEEVVLNDFQRELVEVGQKAALDTRPVEMEEPSKDAEDTAQVKTAGQGKSSVWTTSD